MTYLRRHDNQICFDEPLAHQQKTNPHKIKQTNTYKYDQKREMSITEILLHLFNSR